VRSSPVHLGADSHHPDPPAGYDQLMMQAATQQQPQQPAPQSTDAVYDGLAVISFYDTMRYEMLF